MGLPSGSFEVVKRPTGRQAAFYLLDVSRNLLSAHLASASLKRRAVRSPKPIELKPVGDGALESPLMKDEAELEGDVLFTLDGNRSRCRSTSGDAAIMSGLPRFLKPNR